MFQKLSCQVQKAGTAQPNRRLIPNGRIVPRTVLEGNMIHCSFCSPHAAFNLRAFQSRTCRRRTGEQSVPVAKNHLSVGPNIQKKCDLLLLIRTYCQQAGTRICSYISGNVRQYQEPAPGMNGQSVMH